MKEREIRLPFEKALSALIKKYNGRTDIYDKIIEQLTDKMTKGDIARVWSGNKQPMLMTDVDLLLFSQAFYENIKGMENAESINPKNIFTDNDFNDSLHVITSTNIRKDSITFTNITRVYQPNSGYIYRIPAATSEQISDMVVNNIINYNFDSQREAIIEELFGEEIKIPKIFPQKVDAIAEKILNDQYYSVDTIIINILKTGAERVKFDLKYGEDIGDLTIYKIEGSTNDEIDGANRIQSIVKAYSIAKEKNKKINARFKIDITNVPLRNSNEIIRQINHQTPIEEDRIKALEPSKFMTIATNINIYENEELNILYKKLGESLKEYKDLNKISTIQIFAEGLQDHYKDILEKNNPAMYKDITEYQIDFFNEFFSNYINEIENVATTKKHSVLFDINMFYCYIYISKTLFELYQDNEKQWRKSVKKIARSFDFNKTTEWEKLRTTGKLVPKAKEQLIDFLNSKLSKIIKEDEVALAK